eukprot:CAMPEP_0202479790 /NCGR_PEP_ID=MMETSP1360-20130828/95168_1 /ASSEMBLY_ACC=CAM_ASM_000848 /TAXON_ID=515479 /ORGANISM="Licmophora paradoxa, Strain CCMP2313" /LENGTH=83 /DNA_ID=CAMNT_0049107141 /DNA_START=29 /DNA_END=277 /DNA_ORIENTATION=-
MKTEKIKKYMSNHTIVSNTEVIKNASIKSYPIVIESTSTEKTDHSTLDQTYSPIKISASTADIVINQNVASTQRQGKLNADYW